MAIFIVDLPIKHCNFLIVFCKRLPEGKPPFSYGFPMVFPFSHGFSYGFPMDHSRKFPFLTVSHWLCFGDLTAASFETLPRSRW